MPTPHLRGLRLSQANCRAARRRRQDQKPADGVRRNKYPRIGVVRLTDGALGPSVTVVMIIVVMSRTVADYMPMDDLMIIVRMEVLERQESNQANRERGHGRYDASGWG